MDKSEFWIDSLLDQEINTRFEFETSHISVFILKRLIKPGFRILDAGWGTGRIIIQIAKEFKTAQFIGVDIFKELLNIVKKKSMA